MEHFTIDAATCTACGICIDVCPVGGIIEIKEGAAVPTPTENAAKLCINCGHCVSVCPFGSFSLATMPVDDCEPVDTALFPEVEEVSHLMRSRRSIRRYKDTPVDRESIETLIETASSAPSGHNSQPLSWTVIHDSEKVRAVASETIDWMKQLIKTKDPLSKMLVAPLIVRAWNAGADPICRNAPHLVVVHAPKTNPMAPTAANIALSWFELAAASAGLGGCWAGFASFCASQWPNMIETLGLPEGHSPFGIMMFGVPKYEYKRNPKQKEPSVNWL